MIKNNQSVFLVVKVVTKAKINKIVGWQGDFLKVQLTAIPSKGQANKKLIELLADFLNLSKSKIIIVRGSTTNKKIIYIPNNKLEELKKKFIKRETPVIL